MYFVFIKVFKIEYKEDIILALQSVGVNKGSYYSSFNLDNTLSDDLSVYTTFFKTEEDRAKEQLIMTTLMEDKKTAKQFLENLRESGLSIDEDEILRLVLIPVALAFDPNDGLNEF